MKKALIVLALISLVILVSIASPAWAEPVSVNTMDELIAALENDAVSEIEVSTALTVSESESYTLDLNGKTLTLSKRLSVEGTLTVNDTEGSGRICLASNGGGLSIEGGTVIMSGGTVEGGRYWSLNCAGGSLVWSGNGPTIEKPLYIVSKDFRICFDSTADMGTKQITVMPSVESLVLTEGLSGHGTIDNFTSQSQYGIQASGDELLVYKIHTARFVTYEGSGTMTDQIFLGDIPAAIKPNEFVREGYSFAGWEVLHGYSGQYAGFDFEDEQVVTFEDDLIFLRAKWLPAAATLAELQDELAYGTGNTVRVTADLTVPAGETVLLDLNGKTVEMGSCMLTVNGSLTIIDNRTGGTITGTGDGAGATITVSIGGELTILDGTISKTNNTSGAAIGSYGTVWMDYGTITSDYHGVELYGSGSVESVFTLAGGSITGSGDSPQYGVWAVSTNRFVMTGGSITGWACGVTDGNIAGTTVEISGGQITGNNKAVVLRRNNVLYLSGKPVIRNNTDSNINLTSNMQVFINRPLLTGTSVGFSTTSTAITFADGWSQYMSGKDPGDYFFSNTLDYQIITQGTGLLLSPVRSVSFAANGGEGSMPLQQVGKGIAAVLNANAFTRRGYHFTGWNTRADGTGTAFADGAEINTTDNVTLYACWEINIDWTLENGVLTISGTGEMPDYQSGSAPWSGQSTKIRSVIIGDGITSVGAYSFMNCTGLTGITIPDEVTRIGMCAFYGCSSLAEIDLPDNLEEICTDAFYGCSGLASITIPDGVTTIGPGAFRYCTGLDSLHIPGSVTFIGAYPITGCSGMTAVTVDAQNSAYASEDGVLYDKQKTTLIACPAGKETISVPDSVKTVGAYALDGCAKLTEVVFPADTVTIEQYAFEGCTGLETVTFPGKVTNVSPNAFYRLTGLTVNGPCDSALNAYAETQGFTYNAAHDWNEPESTWDDENAVLTVAITCEACSETIQNKYTAVMTGVEEQYTITLGQTLEITPELELTLTEDGGLPEGTISLEPETDGAVEGTDGDWTQLEKNEAGALVFTPTEEETYHLAVIIDADPVFLYRDVYVRVGDSSVLFEDYIPISGDTLVLPEGLVTIEEAAFAGTAEEVVVIPWGCESIGANAFAGSPNLKEIWIPGTVTQIDDTAFANCNALMFVVCGSETITEYVLTYGHGVTPVIGWSGE